MHEKNILKSANFFYKLYKEKMVTDKATIKIEKEDEREAP